MDFEHLTSPKSISKSECNRVSLGFCKLPHQSGFEVLEAAFDKRPYLKFGVDNWNNTECIIV